MATIYSSDLKLSIMATGENAGTWGSITNTNLYLIQQAIGGYQEVNIAGGAQTTTLAMSDGALSNARNAVIKLTGTITGNQVVTIPTGIEKTYIVSNGTTGAFTVEFKQAGGTGITFGTTDKSTRILFADATNIVDTGTVSTSGVQTLTNKTLTSPIINKIDDANGNEQVIFSSTASAVNELTITNAATGNAPSIATTGSDTNIGLTIAPKGTGDVNVDADTLRVGDSNADATITTNGTGDLTISTNSGSNSGTIKIFDGVNGNIELLPNGSGVVKLDGLSYPTADGSANQALVTNGSGVLSFSSVGGITEVDMWRLTAQLSGDQDPISTNLERVDTNAFTKKGTGMSQTSGNFSFPSTGLYLVTFNTSFSKSGDVRNCNTTILVTTDNNAYNTTSYATDFIQQTESNFTAISGSTTAIINVTSTANIKCRFSVTFSQTTLTQGNTNENNTYMTFIRLGDSV